MQKPPVSAAVSAETGGFQLPGRYTVYTLSGDSHLSHINIIIVILNFEVF